MFTGKNDGFLTILTRYELGCPERRALDQSLKPCSVERFSVRALPRAIGIQQCYRLFDAHRLAGMFQTFGNDRSQQPLTKLSCFLNATVCFLSSFGHYLLSPTDDFVLVHFRLLIFLKDRCPER